MDLAEWYVAGRWVALLELIDMLPTACRLNEAISNDPEKARLIAAAPQPADAWAPRVSEFDLQAVLGQQQLHALYAIKQTLIALKGQKPPAIEPFPGPRTEIQKAIAALAYSNTVELVTMFGFDETDI